MSNVNLCLYCNTKLTNKRSHALFCCGAHRAASWRIEKNRQISIKVQLPKSEYLRIKEQADMSGLLVNAYLLSKVTSSISASA